MLKTRYTRNELARIAAKRGVSARTLRRWVAEGRPARMEDEGARGPRRRQPGLDAETIGSLVDLGMTITEIADEHAISPRTLYRRLVAAQSSP
jgi:predicted DNA-binding transcriptional regulator YafY